MKRANKKSLKVCLRFKEDLSRRREDALWDKFFDVVGLLDSESGEDSQKGGNIGRESQEQAEFG